MAFPAGWPPRPAQGRRSVRVYLTGTTTANFDDNGYLFSDAVGANSYTQTPIVEPGSSTPVNYGDRTQGSGPSGGRQNAADAAPFGYSGTREATKPMLWVQTLRITNSSGNAIEFSFDGTNVHGEVPANDFVEYRNRFEAGIALRFPGGGGAADFVIEGW